METSKTPAKTLDKEVTHLSQEAALNIQKNSVFGTSAWLPKQTLLEVFIRKMTWSIVGRDGGLRGRKEILHFFLADCRNSSSQNTQACFENSANRWVESKSTLKACEV